jgi:biotin carboxyl carrier protein
VVIENGEAIVDGNRYPVTIQEGPSEKPQRRPAKKPRAAKKPEPASAPAPSPTPPTTPVSGDKEKIESPLPGTVVRILSRPGATVKEGEIIMVVESMKMETDITSPTSGTIDSIPVSQGGAVKTGDTLAIIIPTGAQQAPEEEQPEPTAEKKPAAAPKPKGSGARTGAPKPKATPPPKGAAASPVRPAGAKKPSERTQQIKETTIPKGEQEQVNAPLPGSVIRIDVEAGDQVEQNDVIMVIESMKMETDITSPVSGTVESIKVQKNETVKTGDLLAVIAT